MMKQKNPLSNQRGGIVIITMVVISVVIVIFSGIVSFKLTELSHQATRVNEAYRYLNVMEEMGLIVSRARQLGKNGAGNCPTGTFEYTSATTSKLFCLPGISAGSTLDKVCVEDQTQKDATATTIKYCLKASGGLDALNGESNKENVAGFEIIPVKEASYLEKAFYATLTLMGSAYAQCDLNQNWNVPCTPVNTNPTPSPQVVNTDYDTLFVKPAAYSAAPGGAGSGAPGALSSRNNMESWSPTTLAWSPGTVNEIYTPKCDYAGNANQYWLGCMTCSDTNVTCIDIKMCPPIYTTGGVCTQPYRQRIAIYTGNY